MLSTKIRVLSSRGAVVTRSRLIERLNTNPNRRLTLVSAPAGFGKTALVSVWLQGLKREQLDSRLERFLTARDRKGNLRIATKEEFKAEFEPIQIPAKDMKPFTGSPPKDDGNVGISGDDDMEARGNAFI